MNVQQLEEYLDGALSPAEAAAVEQAARSDTQVAAQMAALRRQRQLRAMALASYMPSPDDSAAIATRVLRHIDENAGAPIASLVFLRRAAAVAAVLTIAMLSFWAGRQSGANAIATTAPTVQREWIVPSNIEGEEQRRVFANAEDAKRYADEVSREQDTTIASTGVF